MSGGGAFNLAALTKLTNIQVITAQERQGTTAQTVTLRNNLNSTVNVTPGGARPGITIIGANNTDVINLGAGNDTVTLGNNETVNGGTAPTSTTSPKQRSAIPPSKAAPAATRWW